VADKELSWKFAEDFVVESPAILTARQHSLELGIDPVTPAMGAQLAVLSAASSTHSILEIGTGAGVSGLWLLTGAPDAVLTSIDIELDHQQHARTAFAAGGLPSNPIRLITGRAA
jgi:predicted O-methyltransferase YrrM